MKKILFAAAIFMLSAMNVMAQDKLYLDNFEVEAGKTVDVKLNLSNPDNVYTAVQFDLSLPEGLEIAVYESGRKKGQMMITLNNNEETGRLLDQTCSAEKASNGAYRFVVSSMTSAEIYENSGEILTITLKASDSFKGGAGSVDAIVLVKPNGDKFTAEKTEFQADVKTGIDAIKAADATSDSPVYDLQGRRVEKTTKGLYIVNGNKVVMK